MGDVASDFLPSITRADDWIYSISLHSIVFPFPQLHTKYWHQPGIRKIYRDASAAAKPINLGMGCDESIGHDGGSRRKELVLSIESRACMHGLTGRLAPLPTGSVESASRCLSLESLPEVAGALPSFCRSSRERVDTTRSPSCLVQVVAQVYFSA